MSFRVGVLPASKIAAPDNAGQNDEFKEMASALIGSDKVYPAIMTVILHVRTKPYLVPDSSSCKSTTFSESDLLEGENIGIEINLWRADTAMGVLELDGTGNVVSSNDFALYQPGLMFGVPNESMLNTHISKYLPAADGKPVSEFFTDGFGASEGANKNTKIRGLLKAKGECFNCGERCKL